MHGLEWTEPVAVRQWEWQTQSLPMTKRLFRLFAQWSLLLGVPAFVFVYRVAPTELAHTTTAFLALAILQPLHIVAHLWTQRKDTVRYSVEGKGLRRRASGGAVLYHWKNVESYQVLRHPHVEGIRVLELKMRHYRRVRRWSFNPSQVSEQELIRAIQKYLPERTLRPFGTRISQQGA